MGEHCQNKARSCLSFSGTRNGYYNILTYNDHIIKKDCHFGSANTWTLVQSYSFENNENYRNQPYYKNFPRNETLPNWKDYRLSLDTMKGIIDDGNNRWRISCNYSSHKSSWKNERLFATHLKVPIIHETKSLFKSRCLFVERVHIRGKSWIKRYIPLIQEESVILHLNLNKVPCEGNDAFHGISCYKNASEDNFGYYDCVNPEHTCSSSPQATTQLWFGGKKRDN